MPGLYVSFGKRSLDFIGALLGIVVLAPLLAAIGVAVRMTMGKPVLFRQIRGGFRGRTFVIFKFRTMRNDGGSALPDHERLTRTGRFLRSLSLDELPELFNVLMGDMSFVGPRPLLASYLDRYSPSQASRHDVRPGITGLAQVSGRNSLPWERRFEIDVWYVEHVSALLDAQILLTTFWKVVTREGISEQGEATAQEFKGTKG